MKENISDCLKRIEETCHALWAGRTIHKNRLLAVRLSLDSIAYLCKMAMAEIRKDSEGQGAPGSGEAAKSAL